MSRGRNAAAGLRRAVVQRLMKAEMSNHQDRAAVLATAVLHVVATAPQSELRQQVEAMLRDEIADIKREIAAERGAL